MRRRHQTSIMVHHFRFVHHDAFHQRGGRLSHDLAQRVFHPFLGV